MATLPKKEENETLALDREVNPVTALPSSLVQPFRADVIADRDEVVVALSGELDLESAAVLEREVIGLHAAGHERVVVDLQRIAFMDSTGLRALICLHRAAERQGRRLSLIRGPRPVQRIFELTATGTLFHWRD
jgi:anti-anti-sigma factor